MALSLSFRRRLALLAAVLLPPAALILYRYPPATTPWYPRCVLYATTGLHCPGCGTGRCLHALLQGQLLQALAFNPLTVVVLPFLAGWFVRQGWSALRGTPPPGLLLSVRARWLFVGVVIGFAVLRNIPAFPFTLIAPHRLTPPAESSPAPPEPLGRR